MFDNDMQTTMPADEHCLFSVFRKWKKVPDSKTVWKCFCMRNKNITSYFSCETMHSEGKNTCLVVYLSQRNSVNKSQAYLSYLTNLQAYITWSLWEQWVQFLPTNHPTTKFGRLGLTAGGASEFLRKPTRISSKVVKKTIILIKHIQNLSTNLWNIIRYYR